MLWRYSRLRENSWDTYQSGWSTYTPTGYSCVTGAATAGTQCFEIELNKNTFSEFAFKKEDAELNFKVNPAMAPIHLGKVLSLESFNGKVRVIENTFTDNYKVNTDC